MTNQGPRKKVDAGFWQGRLLQARDYRQAARDAMAISEAGANGNPIISNIVISAIAYGDTLTAKRADVVNQQDHAAAPRLLREVLRQALPDAQEKRFRRLLSYKDQVQYGARRASMDEAVKLLDMLEEFSTWAEDQL